ncbi:Glycoprotein hormone beta-5 [Bagarius yarrelli]|uniref:Glycoprotein hormone beta-5 n=1 Tax=Bagarius yarrelli TaxID=175774 RepID=A0A556V501_BAGYA|nr:Glycoprotein hormone beta-5 [Bagarius yarrelli]
MMSTAAVANGGGVATGSVVAVMQSAGVVGLTATGQAAAAATGAAVTGAKPILDPPFIESHQRVCTYNQTHYVTVQLPNCSAGVDPYYTYPVALKCECAVCVTAFTECITSI